MRMYFSGVDKDTVVLLRQAGITRLVVNPADVALAEGFHFGADSGAYPVFKANRRVVVEEHLAAIARIRLSHTPDFVAMPDVIDDAAETFERWQQLRGRGLNLMPVWHWESPEAWLQEYLADAPLVGIGGLVPYIRNRWSEKLDKAERARWDRERLKVLDQLIALCQKYPADRFHLFGLCWPKACEALRDLAWSADTSLWLAGRRYHYALFEHARTRHLQAAPAKMIEAYRGLDGDALSVANARALAAFCESPATPAAVTEEKVYA